MPIPTELVGSLPRPMKLQEAYQAYDDGQIDWEQLKADQDAAAEDSIRRLEQTGVDVVTDGEQRESSFATYPITDTLAGTGLADNLAGDGSSSRSSTTATTVSSRDSPAVRSDTRPTPRSSSRRTRRSRPVRSSRL